MIESSFSLKKKFKQLTSFLYLLDFVSAIR